MKIRVLFNDAVERNTVYSHWDTLGMRNRLVGYSWSALKKPLLRAGLGIINC